MRGIMFKEELFQAVVAGTKTETRRVVKGIWDGCDPNIAFPHGDLKPRYDPGEVVYLKEPWMVAPSPNCTFGEAMMGKKLSVHYKYIEGRQDFSGGSINCSGEDGSRMHVDYAALEYDDARYGEWRNKMFMPAWAARYHIRITEVRCERLQDIDDAGAVAEGVVAKDEYQSLPCTERCGVIYGKPTHRDAFATLWDTINKPPLDWAHSPWVWVYCFELVKQ
jgi:hypothetical protein